VAVCSCIAAIVVVLRRTRDTLRNGKRVYSRAVVSLAALHAKAELAAAKAERVGEATRELEESLAQLRRAIAQLAILRAAIAEVGATFGWIRVLL
jgi:gamma-glutamylcysteine synthetase